MLAMLDGGILLAGRLVFDVGPFGESGIASGARSAAEFELLVELHKALYFAKPFGSKIGLGPFGAAIHVAFNAGRDKGLQFDIQGLAGFLVELFRPSSSSASRNKGQRETAPNP